MRRFGIVMGGLLAGLWTVAGCGPFEYEDVPAQPSTGKGGAGGRDGQGGSGGQGAAGGQGGVGGIAPGNTLQGDQHLVVRYFINEDPSSTAIKNSAHDGLHLSIVVDDPPPGDLSITKETPGHGGLRWSGAGSKSRAEAPLAAGDKIHASFGAQAKTATIEMAATITEAAANSRLLFIGHGNDDYNDMSVMTESLGQIDLQTEDATVGRWHYQVSSKPIIIHIVINLGAQEPQERRQMFLNGERLIAANNTDTPLDDALDLSSSEDIVLGNRHTGGASIGGTIYYAAIYSSALDPEDIQTNAALLLRNDDGPTPTPPAP